MKTLVTYYSWSGSTKHLAEQIHRQLAGSDLHEIKVAAKDAFPSDMMATAYKYEQQKRTNQWPQINQAPDLNRYGQILVGGPVWDWDVSSPVIAFLQQIQGYSGIVRPFYTSVGNSQRYAGLFKRWAGNLRLGSGFDDAHDDLNHWLAQINE